jgi:elongation factor P--beta-lysine ligase
LYNKFASFLRAGCFEVETPILSQAGVTDVHLASVQAQRHLHGKKQTHYLQTSPEFAMKRLLASGSGAIYQICKVFEMMNMGVSTIVNLPCWNGIVRSSA